MGGLISKTKDPGKILRATHFRLAFLAHKPKIRPPIMDKVVKDTADFYRFVAWLHANRKPVITAIVTVLVIGAGVGGFYMFKNSRETGASEALSLLKLPANSQEAVSATAADARPFMDLAQDYAGTRAAGRALLLAGGILFDAGKYDQAQAAFQRFVGEYPDDPLISQALVGVASSLEAQGKIVEATSHFDDLVRRHQADATTPQAKSALARLYLEQNKPEAALAYYDELTRANNNDTWSSEAGIQREELLAKYPNLRKAAAAPAPGPAILPTQAAPIAVPGAKP